MTKQDEIRQLLAELKAANNERDQRHIRRELRKRGHYVSRDGKTQGLVRGVVVLARRRARDPHRSESVTVTTNEEQPAPATGQVVTTLRLPADLHRRLQLLAADEARSANAIIEELLRKHLDEQGIPSRLKRER